MVIYIISNFFPIAKCILLFFWGGWGVKGSIRVQAMFWRIFKEYFVLLARNWWDCVMGVCIWDLVGEGVSCLVFVDCSFNTYFYLNSYLFVSYKNHVS